MMPGSPVNDRLDQCKEQKVIPLCTLCKATRSRQRAVEYDGTDDEDHQPTDPDDPTDGEVSLQELLTACAVILTENVDGTNDYRQNAPNCSEMIPDSAGRRRDVANSR